MNHDKKILIVEDELNLGTTLSEYLSAKKFNCQWAKSCQEAREFFKSNIPPQIVLMDIGLPDGDGIELAKEFRKLNKSCILLFLSAQNDPQTRYEGLEMGAEDYITKPFDLRELIIRLEKAMQTHQDLSKRPKTIQLSNLEINFSNFEVMDANNIPHALSQKECAILELLYGKLNQVVSRDEIIDQIWGEDVYPTNRTVDNYIVKLRKIIDTDKSNKLQIKSVRGVGYQLILKE
ncbi:MAG: response regulator transcription factor [Bacteriovoracaceae bacterium]|jgi:two-component system alkaline phosphatase synthesis response regulator PhoP|nr:DNA-binding response regulator [Halobacteriovoraceae bacterium]MDP7320438.1 response regulator transcription factor [Bacteriovoracaceae bacterium]